MKLRNSRPTSAAVPQTYQAPRRRPTSKPTSKPASRATELDKSPQTRARAQRLLGTSTPASGAARLSAAMAPIEVPAPRVEHLNANLATSLATLGSERVSLPPTQAAYATFEPISREFIPSLNATLEAYRHTATGARHFHLATDDKNNTFFVGFPTIPTDSTGVAHIIEHTAMCGGRTYQVHSPFFAMQGRTLANLMNAFTAADWTGYMFATQNARDFANLERVYLDLVFFPKLDRLDFAQDGWRYQFAEPDNPNSPLQVTGVVYNEMKGALSEPATRVSRQLRALLFPNSTYRFESGGDPAEMPNLSYEQYRAFRERHYHPTNAVFFTYGSFPAAQQQEQLEKLVLAEFPRPRDKTPPVEPERPFAAPQAVVAEYPVGANTETKNKSYVVLGWRLGDSKDSREMTRARFLAHALLGTSAAPLRRALESNGFGATLIGGLGDSTPQATFACGLANVDAQQAEAIEKLILDTLGSVAREGIPKEQLDAILHQFELSARAVGGGQRGVGLGEKVVPAALRGADVGAMLAEDVQLKDLYQETQRNPRLIQELASQLLANPNRVRLTMNPSAELAQRQSQAERQRLDAVQAGMSAAQKQEIVDLARALKARQAQQDDPNVLPRVGRADIPETITIPTGTRTEIAHTPVTTYRAETNGLVYESVMVRVPQLEPELVDLMPIFSSLLPSLGSAGRDYLQTNNEIAAHTGGISATVSVQGDKANCNEALCALSLSGHALARNQEALARLLQETLSQVHFDEHQRLRELIHSSRVGSEQRLASLGSKLAVRSALAGMSSVGALNARWSGVESLRGLRQLDDKLDDPAELEALAGKLERIKKALLASPREMVVVCDDGEERHVQASIEKHWNRVPGADPRFAPLAPPSLTAKTRVALGIDTESNYCVKAYPAVAPDHPDAAALTVLAQLLNGGYLREKLRELGGAYGGSASYAGHAGAFVISSYRDPRLTGTLDDMDGASRWVLESPHAPEELERAIISAIAEEDEPKSGTEEALDAFSDNYFGRDAQWRLKRRAALLRVTMDDLKRVAANYLKPDNASTAVVTNHPSLPTSAAAGLETQVL